MSKEYKFEFYGTKEDFIQKINTLCGDCYGGYYYYEDYIIHIADSEIRFGVERGGHSGGYWYIPTITECDDKIELCGAIRYIGPECENNRSKFSKVIENIGFAILFVLLIPVWLIVKLCSLIELIIRKINKSSKPKTTEDKLFYLIENCLSGLRK